MTTCYISLNLTELKLLANEMLPGMLLGSAAGAEELSVVLHSDSLSAALHHAVLHVHLAARATHKQAHCLCRLKYLLQQSTRLKQMHIAPHFLNEQRQDPGRSSI